MEILPGSLWVGTFDAGPFRDKPIQVVSATSRRVEFKQIQYDSPLDALIVWHSTPKRFLSEFVLVRDS